MKAIPLSFLLLFTIAANAQVADSLRPTKTQQYLYGGLNTSFVNVYQFDYERCSVCAAQDVNVTHQQPYLPGAQLAYRFLHSIRYSFASYFFDAGLTYYDNRFDYNQKITPPPDSVGEIYRADVHFTSNSLDIPITFGFKFKVNSTLYFTAGLGIHFLLATLNQNSFTASQTDYNIFGPPDTTYFRYGGTNSTKFTTNINGLLGIGYTFNNASKHPLFIELNYMPDLTEWSDILNSEIRRSAVALNIGYNIGQRFENKYKVPNPAKYMAYYSKKDSTVIYRKIRRPKEHFLFVGTNLNLLQISGNPYNVQWGGGAYETDGINNIRPVTPGFQIDYKTYFGLKHRLQFYYGEGLIYYHNVFDIYSTSQENYSTEGISPSNGYSIWNSNEHYNSGTLFLHFIVGFRYMLPKNFYLNFAIEPHLLFNNFTKNNLISTTDMEYDSLGRISQINSFTSYDAGILSFANINGVLGVGYRLWPSNPHPLCIELNFAPDFFESSLFESGDSLVDQSGISIHRYTIELSVGYKF